jgi:hypothetical protein
MSCSIRYHRPGKPDHAGFLIVANESEFPAHKARLEALGYVVSDNLAARLFAIPAAGKA